MKILFVSQVGLGHLTGLGPIATALSEAGHSVMAAGGPSVASFFTPLGITSASLGREPAGSDSPESRSLLGNSGTLDPGTRLIRLRREVSIGERARALLPEIYSLMQREKPDLVIRDSTELASLVAADMLTIPQLPFQVSAHWTSDMWIESCGPVLSTLSTPERPFNAESILDRVYQHGLISNAPSVFREAEPELPVNVLRVRPVFSEGHGVGPEAWDTRPESHLYLGFGSVYRPDQKTISSFVNAHDGAIAVVEPVPSSSSKHVLSRPYLPQSPFMDRCSAVVCHGGRNTVLTALKSGVPVIGMPIGSDNFVISQTLATAGLGMTIPWSATSLADALKVLDTKVAASHLSATASEIAAMPSPDELADTIALKFS